MLYFNSTLAFGYGLVTAGLGFGLSRFFSYRTARKIRKKKYNEAPLVKTQISKCLTGMDAHISNIMENAQVQTDPFPHLVIENFLPKDFYKHASELWPATEEFAGAKNAKRFVLPITYGCFEATHLPKEQKVFWRLFGEVIVNRYLKPKLAKKFKPYLNQKLNLQESWQSFDPYRDTCNLRQDALLVDCDAVDLPPHVDQLNIVAQIMIYFPTDDQHDNLGTVFYSGDPSSTPNNIYEVNN